MNVLCVWWGYCSGAALFREDGNGGARLIGAASEERFSRVKNTSCFPLRTIEWLQTLLLPGERFDCVTYTSNDVGVDYLLADKGAWSVSDYVKENIEYWGPVLLQNKKLDYLDYLGSRLNLATWPGEHYWRSLGVGKGTATKEINENFLGTISTLFQEKFHLPSASIVRVDHHSSHRHYAICTHPSPPEDLLVFTVDGWGDGRNATVAHVKRHAGQIEVNEIFSSRNCSLARIYRFMTLLLGMKPSEHEFKVMGLASYGKQKYAQNALEIFRRSMHFSADTGDFVLNSKFRDSYFTFRELFIAERFDNVAAGLQKWLEEVLIDWVTYFVNKTGVKHIAFSGGVAMNCKAMGELATLEVVDGLHVPPSAGDESHIFGAYYAYRHGTNRPFVSFNEIPYCGYQNEGNGSIRELLKDGDVLVEEVDVVKIVEILQKGGIVSICRGRAEFGARALGNRSFLIDASNMEAKEKLNIAVKNRDFWMPFAPILIDKYAPIYLENYALNAANGNRFMSAVFKTTPLGRADMRSAVHPADGTCRAQVLTENENSFMYSILDEYSKKTSKGALLNTSFNTHGFPIVNLASEAIEVFIETPTDLLILDDCMLIKAKG